MLKPNMYYDQLKESYLFYNIAQKTKKYLELHPEQTLLRMGIGDVSLPLCDAVIRALHEAVNEQAEKESFHGYMPECGALFLREAITEYYKRNGIRLSADEVFVSSGASDELGDLLDLFDRKNSALVIEPAYPAYVDANTMAGREIIHLTSGKENGFLPDPGEDDKADILYICSPNNPTGVVYSEETIRKMTEIMEAKQKEYGTDIYLVSDEPYRELAYDGVEVPYLTKYYNNTIIGYSYSKSLSLPGERIGYLVIPDEVADSEDLRSAANVATRILGFVNAPTLQQKVVAKCLNEKTDISYYDRNREALYYGLRDCGFECIKPEGAFYLFVKSPVEDEKAFCEAGKKYNILMVPGSSFACPGYVRLAYCVSYETIVNALPKFKELAKEYF